MRIPLLLQVLVAVVLGIVLGCFFPVWVIRIFVTFNGIFSQYLGFCIPLIILGLVVSGISQLGSNSGKLLILTLVLAYGSTLFSGFFTYFCCVNTFPQLLAGVEVPMFGENATPVADSTKTPSSEPAVAPTAAPAAEPATESTAAPVSEPTAAPVSESTAAPVSEPTATPAAEATAESNTAPAPEQSGSSTTGSVVSEPENAESVGETLETTSETTPKTTLKTDSGTTSETTPAPTPASSSSSANSAEPPKSLDITPFFKLEFPPILDVMAALLTAFILGIGIPACKAKAMQTVADEAKVLIEKLIANTIIPVLPFFIFGIFLEMTAEGSAMQMLNVFGKVIGIVFILHFTLLFLQFLIAGAVAWRNPFKLLWTMAPAYMTALGTSSSAATIPVTLVQVKKNGVRSAIAEFCVPLCATIHLAGSTLKITAFSIAVMLLMHQAPTLTMYVAFISLLGITMVAAPGVPGGAIMAATAVLASVLGFDQTAIGVMISLYIATDCFGTACNVCGDGAISLIVDRFAREDAVVSEPIPLEPVASESALER